MTEQPPFWMDGDGTYWVEAPGATPQEALDAALKAGLDEYESEHALIVIGEESTLLRDCPLDDCEGHPDGIDCPEIRRTVWRIEAMCADGMAFEPIEAAIAKGLAVHVGDDLVVRDGEVHWASDCWCVRCDVPGKAVEANRANEAPSVPLFEEEATHV
jgi:hypothetical protein